MLRNSNIFAVVAALLIPAGAAAQGTGRVLEDVVARVNNEIITLTDLARARQNLLAEIEEECRSGCTAEQREQMIKDGEANLLRDLIDQSLMVQKAKEDGISVESDLIKYMDRLRQQQNPPIEDLDKLCEAIESATQTSCEDWKEQVRKQMLTQELIRREVRPEISDDEVKAYYEEHKSEFVRKERVFLSEIFCSTQGKPEEEGPRQEQRCQGLRKRIVEGGEDFAKLAQTFSDGSTAAQGGDLGGDGFAREDLAPELAEPVFQRKRGEVTDVIRVQSGFLILRVNQRFEEGQQPLETVQNEIQGRIYYQKLRPELRKYLTDLRGDSYVMLKPGYVDSAGVEALPIVEVEARKQDDEEEGKKKRKKILWIF
jgi:peptidyl-prolyl cis-trans isomerase SurA